MKQNSETRALVRLNEKYRTAASCQIVTIVDIGRNFVTGEFDGSGKMDFWQLDGAHDYEPQLNLEPFDPTMPEQRRSISQRLGGLFSPRWNPGFASRWQVLLCRLRNHSGTGIFLTLDPVRSGEISRCARCGDEVSKIESAEKL